MTANRWWVKLFARWKAKIAAVRADVGLFLAAVRTVAIASGIMAYFDVPGWAIAALMTATFGLIVLYAHLYSEGGVWNQMQRDKRDYSNNFAGPNGRIVQEIGARAFVAGMQGEELSEDQRAAIAREADLSFAELRDGIDIDGSSEE